MNKHIELSFFIYGDGSVEWCDDHVDVINERLSASYTSDEDAYSAYAEVQPFIRGYYFFSRGELGIDMRYAGEPTECMRQKLAQVKVFIDKTYGINETVSDNI